MLRLGSDCVCVASCAPDTAPTRTLDDGLMVNEWGIGMRNHGLYDDFELHPLAHVETVEDVEAFPFPDPDAPGRFRLAQEAIEKYGKDYGIIGDLECSIFETSWYLVGLEKLFMGMAMEEPWVDALFDKVAAFHTRVGCTLAALGADVIWRGDDIGSQNGPMISVEMFDRYFFPRIRTMFAEFKKVKPDVKIACIYGGQPMDRQRKALQKHPQIVVATPGRLLDHMGRGTIFLGNVYTAVLDEADEMLKMGFIKDVRRILNQTPGDTQMVMFSATISREVMDVAWANRRTTLPSWGLPCRR